MGKHRERLITGDGSVAVDEQIERVAGEVIVPLEREAGDRRRLAV